METPRERVLKAIEHIQPEVVPVHIMGFAPIERWIKHFSATDNYSLREKLGLDIQEARPVYTGRNTKLGLDIWGKDVGIGGADGAGYSSARGGYPLVNATSVSDIDNFAWPDPDDFDYQVVANVLNTVPDDVARFVKVQYAVQAEGQTRNSAARGGGLWIPLLCALFDLFGMEQALINLYAAPKLIETTIAHLEEFTLGFVKRLLNATRDVGDIFYYGDDFAGQGGMLISPEQWRRFLKPSYKKIYGLGKSYGMKVWIHECGTFRPVIGDMIDLGMDVWETVQVHLPGNEPEVLKREYGQNLAFYGAVNTQRTLPYGTPEEVRAEVRERIRVLGKGGGYICGSDHSIMVDVSVENVLAMLDEAKQFRF
jgi:uroporphyrinogen decarboxylase